MCTVVTLCRPGHRWPLIVGANRDERLDRPWDAPGRWWPDRPGIVGGRDRTAGGTWMALGPRGVVAAVLNRPGSLGPAPGYRSRGELPLLAADAASAADAVAALLALDPAVFRDFNMLVADAGTAWFVRNQASQQEARPLEEPLTMITAHDPNDRSSPRVARHLPRFAAAETPDPDEDRWEGWADLLSEETATANAAEALLVSPRHGFGTVCSTLLALGRDGSARWRFRAVQPQPGGWRELPVTGAGPLSPGS